MIGSNTATTYHISMEYQYGLWNKAETSQKGHLEYLLVVVEFYYEIKKNSSFESDLTTTYQ
jgi:hypothetical protein